MRRLLARFFGWLNRKLYIVETDPEKNDYYDRVDQEIDLFEQWHSTDAKVWRQNRERR